MIAWLLLHSLALAEPGCGAAGKLLPPGAACTTSGTTSAEVFHKAADDASFGVKIELLLSRGGQPFRPTPLTTPLCNGDSLAFRLVPAEQGFVHVLTHGTSGAWRLLYPPAGVVSAAFSPQEPVRLPRSDDEGYPVSGPAGDEYVLFYLSPRPFSGLVQQELHRLLRHLTPSERAERLTGGGHRAFLLLGEASGPTAYVVGDGELRVVAKLIHASCGADAGDDPAHRSERTSRKPTNSERSEASR